MEGDDAGGAGDVGAPGGLPDEDNIVLADAVDLPVELVLGAEAAAGLDGLGATEELPEGDDPALALGVDEHCPGGGAAGDDPDELQLVEGEAIGEGLGAEPGDLFLGGLEQLGVGSEGVAVAVGAGEVGLGEGRSRGARSGAGGSRGAGGGASSGGGWGGAAGHDLVLAGEEGDGSVEDQDHEGGGEALHFAAPWAGGFAGLGARARKAVASASTVTMVSSPSRFGSRSTMFSRLMMRSSWPTP